MGSEKPCQSADPLLSEDSDSIPGKATGSRSRRPGMPIRMAKKRTDAERRVRQSDRLARVLRLLQLIQGPGNWNVPAIAKKLDCSERTVYRDLQTLSAAGVPWYFDDFSQAYKLREGYRGHFAKILSVEPADPQAESQTPPPVNDAHSIATLAREAAQRLLVEAEGVVQALDRLTKAIEDMSGPRQP